MNDDDMKARLDRIESKVDAVLSLLSEESDEEETIDLDGYTTPCETTRAQTLEG